MNNSFNVDLYEKQLSPYGQKVLRVLVEQWHEEKANNNDRIFQRNVFTQQSKTLRDSTKRRDSFDQLDPCIDQHSRKKCTLKFVEKEKNILKPFELLNNKTNVEKSEEIMCSDQLINPAVEFNKDCNTHLRVNDEIEPDVYKFIEEVELIPILDSESTRVSPSYIHDVPWSNMFDTELFHNKETIKESYQNKLDDNLAEMAIDTTEQVITMIDTFEKPEMKLPKRKNTSKLIESKPKKEKKLTVSNTKNIPRKENYAKAVKIWLKDVKNKSSFDIIDSCNNGPIPTNDNEASDNKNQGKGKKKVVQSQLANKDGKMKFGKPKTVIEKRSTETNLAVDAKPDKEAGKEKKNRIKFVAPIKSQIPVKDVTYNIILLDAHNVENFANELTGTTSSDVFVVIVYRNGFCQLNSNFTEDSCIPEGIIIYTNDNFFYFKTLGQIEIRTIIVKVFEANTIICFEGKDILILLSHLKIPINPVSMCDTKIGGALLDPDSPPESFSDLQKLVSHVADYTIATECSLQKAAWYMTQLKEVTETLRIQLIGNSLWNVFVDLEMRLLPIVADMECRGVSVDLDKLKSMEHILVSKLKTVEQECHKVAGRQFQVNSQLQVRGLLYDELKLDEKCNLRVRETLAKGAKSTSESTLRSLMSVHPLPRLILEYRHLHKAHATFLTGIAQHVKDGIVRPTWVQTAAATGRIASNNPNLQAIPKAPYKLIMFPQPDDIDNPELNFRSVYTCRPGHCLLAADFKHVECRVLAHAAADDALLHALHADDLFRVLAAKWLNKSEGEVSSADRERTKRIVYASLYGAGARKLMDILDTSYEQTLAIVASFNRTFPSLKSFGRGVVRRCELAGGRLRTPSGRARTFKDISSADFAARSHAERQAVNFIVQGSAADICKTAMILTEEALRGRAPPLRARLVLQIHDELVWEVHDEDLATTAEVVQTAMEGCGVAAGAGRLPVALAAGRSWGRLEPYHVTHV